jgi:hypothetical protein
MKKKSIKKLKLQKASIAELHANALAGGTNQSRFEFCLSINVCETIHFSRCYGEADCVYYP